MLERLCKMLGFGLNPRPLPARTGLPPSLPHPMPPPIPRRGEDVVVIAQEGGSALVQIITRWKGGHAIHEAFLTPADVVALNAFTGLIENGFAVPGERMPKGSCQVDEFHFADPSAAARLWAAAHGKPSAPTRARSAADADSLRSLEDATAAAADAAMGRRAVPPDTDINRLTRLMYAASKGDGLPEWHELPPVIRDRLAVWGHRLGDDFRFAARAAVKGSVQ